MLDIHVLLPPLMNAMQLLWYSKLLGQLEREEINLHVIENCTDITEGRIKGYEMSKGPWIGFVDADDLIEPGIFRKINNVFKAKSVDIVSCQELIIDEYDRRIAGGVLLTPFAYPEKIRSLFLPNINHHIFCFCKSELNPNYYDDSKRIIAEHPECNLGDCTYAAVRNIAHQKAYLMPEIGYYYRRHPYQITAGVNNMIDVRRKDGQSAEEQGQARGDHRQTAATGSGLHNTGRHQCGCQSVRPDSTGRVGHHVCCGGEKHGQHQCQGVLSTG